MLVRVLTATDMLAIEAVALSNAGNKKWLGLDKSNFPLEHGAVVGLMERLIALDYWRFFGAFDDAGNLLTVFSFYFWCQIENGKYVPTPPDFFGYYNVYTNRTSAPKMMAAIGHAYNETWTYAFNYFAERGFTTRWVAIPADPKFRLRSMFPFGEMGNWKHDVIYEVAAGSGVRYPSGHDENNPPQRWKWMVGPSSGWDIDYSVIRDELRVLPPLIGFDPMSAAWTWQRQPGMAAISSQAGVSTCAVVDVETRVVFNVIIAGEADKPRVGTMLKRTPAADGTDARAGLRWLDGSFEQPMIDGPIPW